jgi:hypothetical protein
MTLSNNDSDDHKPQIHNGQVVWQGYDGQDYEIFYWDGTNIHQLTNNNYDDVDPQINNGQVVWQGYDGHDWEIFFWQEGMLEVLIDIKPGSYPNSINLKSKGKISVAILTTDDFSAQDVDPETCVFAGAGPPLRSHMYDLGKDGDDDMILHFKIKDLEALNKCSTEASLECETYDGTQITGTDSVKIVPKCRWHCSKCKECNKENKDARKDG